MINDFTIIINPEATFPLKKDGYTKYATSIFQMEYAYITQYVKKFIITNKAFKEMHKSLDKADKTTRITIAIDAQDTFKQNKIQVFKKSRSMVCRLVSYSYKDIVKLRGTDRTEKILEIILYAASLLEIHLKGIEKLLVDAVESFRESEYKNIWIHQKKQIKDLGTVKLICELTMFDFTLDFVVEDKSKKIIYEKRLLFTDPHISSYYREFKSLVVEGETIKVTDRISEKAFFIITIDEIKKNSKGTFIQLGLSEEEKEKLIKAMVEKTQIEPDDPTYWEKFTSCIQNTDNPCPDLDELDPRR
jgi:hypothetical protein